MAPRVVGHGRADLMANSFLVDSVCLMVSLILYSCQNKRTCNVNYNVKYNVIYNLNYNVN